jgi:ABC-type glycerol-3-phosphate transport system substrate-binding protein
MEKRRKHMKRGLTWLILTLAFMMVMALPAAAAPGDAALFETTEGSSSGRSMAQANGQLYVLDSEKGLYRLKPGETAPELVMDFSKVRYDGAAVDNAPKRVALPSEQGSETAPRDFLQLYYLFGGGDALYAMDYQTTSLWKYDEAAHKFVLQAEFPEDAFLDRSDGEYTEPRNFTIIDGQIYMFFEDYSGDYKGVIRRFDPAAGTSQVVAEGKYVGFAPYQAGKLLVAQGEYGDMTGAGVVDIATGQFESRLTLEGGRSGQCTDMAYDATSDTVYFCRSGEILRSVGFGEPEAVAYLPIGLNSSGTAQALPGEYYALITYENVYVRNVDPQYKPGRALIVSGGNYNDIVTRFTANNPDVPVTAPDDSYYGDEALAKHIAGPSAADIYFLYANNNELDRLYEKGYLADLSGNQKIMDAVGRMNPLVRDRVIKDGRLIALPTALNATGWAANLTAFQAIGLTEADVPTTWIEMLDFVDRWTGGLQDEYPDMQLFPGGRDIEMKSELFNRIFQAQLLVCQQSGQPVSFDTPAIRALLEKLERIDFSDYPGFGKSDGYSYGSDEAPKTLFDSGWNVAPTRYGSSMQDEGVRFVPMALSLDGQSPALIEGDLYVAALSPKSVGNPQAIQFLEYCAENPDAEARIALVPGADEPVEDPYYRERLKYHEEYMSNLRFSMESADENEKKQYQKMLDEAEESFAAEEKDSRYLIDADEIGTYRNMEDKLVISQPNPLYAAGGDAAKEVYELTRRYMDGQIKADQFLMEINQKLKMIALEG